MNNVNNQLNRMKAMMTYGLKTESKNNSYNSVEYQREGADGKLYGIVREGTKFYIKVSDKTKGALKEDFNYIGGFRNRKDNEYTSYANALKQFDIKMISLKEAKGNTKLMVESWNPENNEKLMVEATASMQREIARQRQIMGNAATIFESRNNYSVEMMNEGCEKVDKACKAIEKGNLKGEKKHDCCGDVTCNGGDPFTEKAKDGEDSEGVQDTQKTNIGKAKEPVTEGEQVLGWNDNADYLDTSHGTEVGDDAPFTEGEGTEKDLDNGTVAEGVAMHTQGDDQNSPAVGVGEVGDDAPFTEKAKNELQESDFFHNPNVADDEQLPSTPDEVILDDEDMEDDFDLEGEEDPFGDEELEADFESDLDEPAVEEEFDSDVETRLSAIEDMLAKIAEKMGVDAFEDDDLYDDESSDSEDEESEEGAEDFGSEDDFGDEEESFEDEEDDFEVYESRNYRKMMMKEDRLDYFGKHPAYQKEPMELPSNKHQEMPDYYDMNDESVENEQPYGQQIGDSAPFEIDPQTIENAIAESIKRILGNKKKI